MLSIAIASRLYCMCPSVFTTPLGCFSSPSMVVTEAPPLVVLSLLVRLHSPKHGHPDARTLCQRGHLPGQRIQPRVNRGVRHPGDYCAVVGCAPCGSMEGGCPGVVLHIGFGQMSLYTGFTKVTMDRAAGAPGSGSDLRPGLAPPLSVSGRRPWLPLGWCRGGRRPGSSTWWWWSSSTRRAKGSPGPNADFALLPGVSVKPKGSLRNSC